MSVRDTIILNPKDLRYLLIDSLRLYSDNVVFIDGNLLHAVTNLCNEKKVDRFSMQIYTDYLRNTNKHGKYGTYDSRIWN